MKDTIRRGIVWLLTLEARAVLRKYKPKIIVVTGSVGKTSTKDALYTALSKTHSVRKSEKSFNSDIGAPLTVLGVPNGWSDITRWIRNLFDGFLLILLNAPYPQWLIVEVGADRPGDISRSLAWLKPNVVVATRFPMISVHVEFYDSPEAVQQEELAPLGWLLPHGVAVVNAADEVAVEYPLSEGRRMITYGVGGNVHAVHQKVVTEEQMPTGIRFDVVHKDERASVVLRGVIGDAHIESVLGGIAGAVALGLPLGSVASAFEAHVPPPGRMRLIRGVHNSTLIDDTYNASPVAALSALKTLGEQKSGRRIAVLGDMLELGPYSAQEHANIGEAASAHADILVTVGVRARRAAERALEVGMLTDAVLQFDRATDAGEHLAGILEAGDVVLLKGSQGMRMERAVKLLMERPEEAKNLLCRQDAEWLTR
jgi:UDP-N-acetylmuramoyl-tripeptide--D-alanyl-D-alanine ligase